MCPPLCLGVLLVYVFVCMCVYLSFCSFSSVLVFAYVNPSVCRSAVAIASLSFGLFVDMFLGQSVRLFVYCSPSSLPLDFGLVW